MKTCSRGCSSSRRAACRLACLLLLASLPAAAVEIRTCIVERDGRAFLAVLDADIGATPASVYRAITDYDHLTAINPSIERSEVVAVLSADTRRVDMTVRVCILIFCKDLRRVLDVTHVDATTIEAVMVEGQGDFRAGSARWAVSPAGTGTRLQYRERFEPDFWVPPLIGPWLIRRKLIEEVLVTGRHLEAHAHE